jgi:type IV pilus assembly protein PilA
VKKYWRKFARHFRYGNKGFTLIELLVVIAILGVLAAVVVPNVSKFMGEGKDEAGLTELHSVQTAVTAMMADLGIVTITPSDNFSTSGASPENDMTAFPGTPAAQRLFNGGTSGTVHYLQKNQTEFYYTCEADGTVRGWWESTGTGGAGEIGVVSAP